MNVSYLLYPGEFTKVINFSAVQRTGPFHIRNNYLGLKMWILLAGIWICNSKGICVLRLLIKEEISRALLDCCGNGRITV